MLLKSLAGRYCALTKSMQKARGVCSSTARYFSNASFQSMSGPSLPKKGWQRLVKTPGEGRRRIEWDEESRKRGERGRRVTRIRNEGENERDGEEKGRGKKI